jgi:hypothetical protein
MAEPLKIYRFTGTAGKHNHKGKMLKPGDEVGLTEAQAKAFRDRFALVGPPPEESTGTEGETPLDDDNKNALNSGGDDKIEEGGETRPSGGDLPGDDEDVAARSPRRRR